MRLKTIGGDALCAWQFSSAIVWVQTRSPNFARKLARRQDSRLVMRGVSGGYLRTFEFRHSLTWAQRLIRRYSRSLEVTNEQKTTSDRSPKGCSPARDVRLGSLDLPNSRRATA